MSLKMELQGGGDDVGVNLDTVEYGLDTSVRRIIK